MWLLGAGYHRSGERSDAYATLKRRDEADELFPTEQDYLDLEPDPSDYVKAVARDAPDLVARARHAPGDEVRGDLAGVLDVSVLAVVVEDAGHRLEEVWVGILMPPKGPIPPHPAWLLAALAALFPGAEPEELHYGGDFPRPQGSRPGEIVVCRQL